jgi:predicted AAA+ superfamily ATPase
LGRELATHLTGRYVEATILPFSFREFLKAKGFGIDKEYLALRDYQGRILNLLSEYLEAGGFPEVVVKNLEFKPYVESLFNGVILKDVVRRYKIRFASSIYELARYLVSNFSSPVSFRRLNNVLGFRSIHTVINYTKYLEETFLIFSLSNFSFKVSEQIRSPRKVYVIDNSIISSLSFRFLELKGRLMENLVAVELLRRKLSEGSEIFYLKADNSEVDFVLKEGLQVKQLIQVTYASSRNDVDKREVRALLKASEQLRCKNLLVITWDYEEEIMIDNRIVRFVPLWKWLLQDHRLQTEPSAR